MDIFLSNYGYLFEYAGVLTGLLYVIYNIKQKTISWYFGLLCYLIYIITFTHEGLYAGAILSFVSFLFMLYGLYTWKNGQSNNNNMNISVYSLKQRILLIAMCIILTVITYISISNLKGVQIPLGDSIIAGVSFVGLYIAAHKKLETWYLWTGINIFATGFYLFANLLPTAGLYSVFLACSFYGLMEWKKIFSKLNQNVLIKKDRVFVA